MRIVCFLLMTLAGWAQTAAPVVHGVPLYTNKGKAFVQFDCQAKSWKNFPLPAKIVLPNFPLLLYPNWRSLFTDGQQLFELFREKKDPKQFYCRVAFLQRREDPALNAWIWLDPVALPGEEDHTEVYGFLDHWAILGYLRTEKRGAGGTAKYFCFGKLDLLDGKLTELDATYVTGKHFVVNNFANPTSVQLFLSDGRIGLVDLTQNSVRYASRKWTDGLRYRVSQEPEVFPDANVTFLSDVFPDCEGRLYLVVAVRAILDSAEADRVIENLSEANRLRLRKEGRWPLDPERMSEQRIAVVRYDPSDGKVDQLEDDACQELYRVDADGHQVGKPFKGNAFRLDAQGHVRAFDQEEIQVAAPKAGQGGLPK